MSRSPARLRTPSASAASTMIAAPLRGSKSPRWPGVWPGSASTSTRQSRPSASPPRPPGAQRLAAGGPDVHRRVAAELALEEGDVLGRGAEPVRLVPAVVAGQHGRVGLDPRAVGLTAQDARRRGGGAQRAVAAAVVDVGVGEEDVVEVAERAA